MGRGVRSTESVIDADTSCRPQEKVISLWLFVIYETNGMGVSMPKFLEAKLKAEYPGNPSAVYGTMNKLGVMKGNQETPKGKALQAKHEANHPHKNLGKYLHKAKSR